MLTAVTGASGHVGANLVRAMVGRGRPLRLLAHDDGRALDGIDAERVHADVRDRASLERAFAGAEVVYHLAARISIVDGDEPLVRQVNVEGTRNVVAACLAAGVKRLVHFSSIHALSSEPADQPIDETRPLADGPRLGAYDRSKADAEREVLAGVARGLDAVILVPTAMIGPFDFKPSRMGAVLLDLYHRRLVGLVNGGFDFVDVRDVVEAAIAVEKRGRAGERYLLSGRRLSLRALAEVVTDVTGVAAPRLTAPMWMARAAAPAAAWYAARAAKEPLFTPSSLHALRNHRLVCSDKAARELGYQARPIRDTIADTFAWFKAQHAL
jgi:dihydroflavonol-4-reductase